MIFRSLIPSDWPSVSVIYQQGIDTGDATFETQAPTLDELATKYLAAPQLIAEENSQIIGWAMLSQVSVRKVYAGVAEVSIYVALLHQGKGVGKALLKKLVAESEQSGIWTLQAGIFPENEASVSIHVQCGFRQVGYREKLAKRNGVWRDVLLLERRSVQTGQD